MSFPASLDRLSGVFVPESSGQVSHEPALSVLLSRLLPVFVCVFAEQREVVGVLEAFGSSLGVVVVEGGSRLPVLVRGWVRGAGGVRLFSFCSRVSLRHAGFHQKSHGLVLVHH